MCTPQLRAQTAALQGGPNPNPTAANTGARPVIDPMRRQILALAPLTAGQGFAPSASGLTAGTGKSPLRGMAANPAALPTQVSPPVAGGRDPLSISDMLANGARNAASPKPDLTPGNVKKPDSYDEKHAPTPDTLAEVVRDIRKRAPFSPPERYTHNPFAYDRDYRTTPVERRWLAEPEARLGDAPPYPTGAPGSSDYQPGDRARMRVLTGYLYTLPEVKAFLDVLSNTKGTVKDGYFTTHSGKPPAASLSSFAHEGRQGRYQLLTGTNDEIIKTQMARSDFGEVTQDLATIALLVREGAMDKLVKGDLRGAFTAASRPYASLPMSERMDHSGYTPGGSWTPNDTPVPRQHSIHFAELPALYLARLNARRTEFREAQQNWRSKGDMPWAFISPYRQRYFGRDAFKPSR